VVSSRELADRAVRVVHEVGSAPADVLRGDTGDFLDERVQGVEPGVCIVVMR
jgi:hypothetical protein